MLPKAALDEAFLDKSICGKYEAYYRQATCAKTQKTLALGNNVARSEGNDQTARNAMNPLRVSGEPP